MEKSESGKFEQEWSKAFHQAEGNVSGSVWNNIDLELLHAESGAMRKRVIFYQRLAAAAVLFALLVGGGSLYFNGMSVLRSSQYESLLVNGDSNAIKSETLIKDPLNQKESSDQSGNTASIIEENKSDSDDISIPEMQTDISAGGNSFSMVSPTEDVVKSDQRVITNSLAQVRRRSSEKITSLNDIPQHEAVLAGSPREVTLWRKLPAISSAFMDHSKKEKKNKSESLWASVGASAGNYTPNISSSASSVMSPSTAFADALSSNGASQSSSQGSAYSFGMAMGTKVTDRWVFQGGINYLSQTLGYQSNLKSTTANNEVKAIVSDYRTAELSNVQVTSPYKVNSTNEIVSLPLQAGYLIVNRKFGLQVNTGVATDFFIRNTLVDQTGQLSKFSETAGSNSPYRSVSWSGLLGTELTYKLANQYRISLVPGLRYSFNSVLKEQSGSISNPLMMDVGFRFRYIFK